MWIGGECVMMSEGLRRGVAEGSKVVAQVGVLRAGGDGEHSREVLAGARALIVAVRNRIGGGGDAGGDELGARRGQVGRHAG